MIKIRRSHFLLQKRSVLALLLALILLAVTACSAQESATPSGVTTPAAATTVSSEAGSPSPASAESDSPTATPLPPTVEEEPATSTPEEGLSQTPEDEAETGTMTSPAGEVAQLPDECPPATAELQLLYNPQQGYCLLYPAEYKVEKPNADETILVIGGLLNTADPRASIRVTPADGRSASELADQVVAEFDSVVEIERGEVALGGETAVSLNGLPGQDTYRQLIAHHEGRIVTLTFSPLDAGVDAALDELYTWIIDSFTFTAPVPGDFEDCLQVTEQTQLLRQVDQGYCLLLPTGYQWEKPNDDETVIYVDSLLNTGRPRLFIEVTDAAGKTAAEVADEFLSGLGPGFEVERSFGLTVGYEIAELLDNVPGQDISRLVLVVHDGRLYELTFIPASEDAGEVYQEMEGLYDMVVRSFRFLP